MPALSRAEVRSVPYEDLPLFMRGVSAFAALRLCDVWCSVGDSCSTASSQALPLLVGDVLSLYYGRSLT